MAKITTKVEHTLIISEEDRLAIVAALRYKAAKTCQSTAKIDNLIAVIVGNDNG